MKTGPGHKHPAANLDPAVPALSAGKARFGAQRRQMGSGPGVGTLRRCIANRPNAFRVPVERPPLDATTRHTLPVVKRRARCVRDDVVMPDGTLVPADVRRLARWIMRWALARTAGLGSAGATWSSISAWRHSAPSTRRGTRGPTFAVLDGDPAPSPAGRP